jgi:hypothetical protein
MQKALFKSLDPATSGKPENGNLIPLVTEPAKTPSKAAIEPATGGASAVKPKEETK